MKTKEGKRPKKEAPKAAAEGEPRQRREIKQPEPTPTPPTVPTQSVEIGPLDRLRQIIEQENKTLTQKLGKELAELRKLVKEREDYLKLLQRVQADFSNYQKRVKREKEEWQKYQHEDIVKELLPALDNLDRSTSLKCESEEAKSLWAGVELSQREILRILEKNGVTIIKPHQDKFNPAFHEAVGTIESTDTPPGIILEEVRPGFMIHDRVLRPAQVKVAIAPKTKTTSPDTPEKDKQA